MGGGTDPSRVSHLASLREATGRPTRRLMRLCPVASISQELVRFDTQAMENPEISGGLTKFNRSRRCLPKAHWLDAACVGTSTPDDLSVRGVVPLLITAQGHGCRQIRNVDRFGFPRGKAKQGGRVKGFQTGDLVRAAVPQGKYADIHSGRVLMRASGSFDIRTRQGRVQGIGHHYCTPLHRSDGYSYRQDVGSAAAAPTAQPA